MCRITRIDCISVAAKFDGGISLDGGMERKKYKILERKRSAAINICKKRGVLFGKSVNISCSIELKTIRGMYYNLKPYQMDEYTYIDTLGSIQGTEKKTTPCKYLRQD